jgi:ribonuclease P protein component
LKLCAVWSAEAIDAQEQPGPTLLPPEWTVRRPLGTPCRADRRITYHSNVARRWAARNLTYQEAAGYGKCLGLRGTNLTGSQSFEEDLPTQSASACQDTRIPRSHADPGRAPNIKTAPPEGSPSPDSVNPDSAAFPKQYRLLRRLDFQRVYRQGQRRSASLCTVFYRPNGLAETRLGITTPRRLGTAVVRNRIKRRIREIFRLHRRELPEGWDIVLNPRPSAATVAYPALERELLRLFPSKPPGASSVEGHTP